MMHQVSDDTSIFVQQLVYVLVSTTHMSSVYTTAEYLLHDWSCPPWKPRLRTGDASRMT